MNRRRTGNFNHWIHRHRVHIATLLAVAVLFNTVHVFAAILPDLATPSTNLAAHMPVQEIQASCCDSQSQEHKNCYQGSGCTCMAHCASLVSSQHIPVLHDLHDSKPLSLADNMPTPHVFPPPQRPPRA